MPIDLEDLRGLVLSERETGRLIALPQEVYENTHKAITGLIEEVYATEDPFSEEARRLIERVSSIRATLEDLFRIRSEKILLLAETQIEPDLSDRDEIRRMLPAEREMYEQILTVIRDTRSALVEGKAAGFSSVSEPVEECTTNLARTCPSGSPEGGKPRCIYRMVRILADMDPFMGIDGRIYHLHENDIVTVPERNAEVLVERNIVLNINLS